MRLLHRTQSTNGMTPPNKIACFSSRHPAQQTRQDTSGEKRWQSCGLSNYALRPSGHQPEFGTRGAVHSALSRLLRMVPPTPVKHDLELHWRIPIRTMLHHPARLPTRPAVIMDVCNALTDRVTPSCSTVVGCSQCLSRRTLDPNYYFPKILNHDTFLLSL